MRHLGQMSWSCTYSDFMWQEDDRKRQSALLNNLVLFNRSMGQLNKFQRDCKVCSPEGLDASVPWHIVFHLHSTWIKAKQSVFRVNENATGFIRLWDRKSTKMTSTMPFSLYLVSLCTEVILHVCCWNGKIMGLEYSEYFCFKKFRKHCLQKERRAEPG